MFSSNIAGLIDNQLVSESNGRFQITSLGKEFLLSDKYKFSIYGKKTWREIPKNYQQERISLDVPYIPSRSRLDTRHFKKD